MREYSRPLLTVLALILILWLVLGFWSLSAMYQWTLSISLIIAGGLMLWRHWRHHQSRHGALSHFCTDNLPPEGYPGNVLLVIGDSASWFSPGQTFRETRQGWYLQVNNPEELPAMAEMLAMVCPALLPQTSVLMALLPESHKSEEDLGHSLRCWQRAIIQCRSWLCGIPPLLVMLVVSGKTQPDNPSAEIAHWFTVTPDDNSILVRLPSLGTVRLSDWLLESPPESRLFRINQGLLLNSLLGWYEQNVGSLLNNRTENKSSLHPVAVGFSFIPVKAVRDNLWHQHIAALTTLKPSASTYQNIFPLPDVLSTALPGRRGLSDDMQFWHPASLMLGLFLLLAMLSSFNHNKTLIQNVSDHLALYHRLEEHPPAPKAQAQQRLQADMLQLSDWLRRGEPVRYGMGLYQGLRLIPPVEASLIDWTPPRHSRPVTAKQATGPKTIRLDSLSLFESGQSRLKPASTKVLINALVDIKAKPGLLIVINGHTDNTGSPHLNEVLSLKRAEAVRDWIRNTGDMPESCFAVKGYGASRPVNANDTAEGRAFNRRVEISLVPQANACRIPDQSPASSQDDDASINEMEK